MSRFVVLAALCAAAAVPSPADTIHMKNGTPVDGVVESRSEGMLTVRVGKRRVRLREDEVQLIEENDRDGSFNLDAAREEAKRRDAELSAQTGLNYQQRMAVDAALEMLFSDLEDMSADGRRKLIEMQKTSDLLPYMLLFFSDMYSQKRARLLRLIFEFNPEKVRPLLSQHACDPEETLRAACLELMGKVGEHNPAEVELLVRGLADEKDAVRLAACRGLAAARSRKATPMLIHALRGSDLRVQNLSRDALTAAWSTPEAVVRFEKADEWAVYWDQHAASVPTEYFPDRVVPLVEPGALPPND